MKKILSLAFAILLGPQAFAQTGNGTLGTIPYFLGTNVQGFGKAVPGTAGFPLVSNGPLAAPSFQGISAAGVSYTAPGTGGVTTTQQVYDQRTLWANDYGAVCDTTTDDSLAFQRAANEALALAVPLKFIGQCRASFTVTGGLNFSGTGPGSSVLIPKTAADDGIVISTETPVYFHDFQISYNPYGGANAGVSNITLSALTQNPNSVFSNLTLDYGYYGFNTVRASGWTLENTKITNARDKCVVIRNNNVADSGDSTISNVECVPSSTASVGFYQESSSGLRIINSKFNGGSPGIAAAVEVNLAAATNLADLFITGNSFEGISITGAAIKLHRQGATGGMGTVSITGNELSGLNCVSIPTDAAGAWIFSIAITGGNCLLANSAVAIAYNIDSSTAVNITGGTAQAFVAGSKLFNIGSQVTNCDIGIVSEMGVFSASTYTGVCSTNLNGLKNGTANSLPYYSSLGTLSFFASANNALVTTSGAGVPSENAPASPLAITASVLGCPTCTTSAAALTANRIVLGNGLQTMTVLGSLGTTSTVLHGNAAGVPSFGPVALGTDVSGTLQAAQFPALTGDVTTVAGALATTLVTTQPSAHTWSGAQTFNNNTTFNPTTGVGGFLVNGPAASPLTVDFFSVIGQSGYMRLGPSAKRGEFQVDLNGTFYVGLAADGTNPVRVAAGSSVSDTLIVSAGHILGNGGTPSVSSCGTSPGTPTGSDNFGKVVAGSGVLTSCVINFAHTWGAAPSCTVSSPTAIASLTVATSTTQLTIGGTSLTSDTLAWTCGASASLPSNDNIKAAANENNPLSYDSYGVYNSSKRAAV